MCLLCSDSFSGSSAYLKVITTMSTWLAFKKTLHLPQSWLDPPLEMSDCPHHKHFCKGKQSQTKPLFFFLILPTTVLRGHSLCPSFRATYECRQKAILSIENSLITLPFLHRFFFFPSLPGDIRESEVTYIFYSFIKSSPDRVTLLITREQNAWKNPFITVKGASVCGFQYAEPGKIQLSANANLLLC